MDIFICNILVTHLDLKDISYQYMTTPTMWPEHFWQKSPPSSWKIAIFVNLSHGYMHYHTAALNYLVKRAFLVVRFAQYVTHICTTITNRRFSIVYGPKSEKRKPPFTLILYWADFSRSSFFCQDRRSLLAKCCVCGKKSCWKWCYIYIAEPSWKALYVYSFFFLSR